MSEVKPILIDSHCHLNRIDLTEFETIEHVLQTASDAGVNRLLSVCVELEEFPILCQLAEKYPQVFISVGVHPDSDNTEEPDAMTLDHMARHPKCIAIGETGLDYYRVEADDERAIQRQRFREHIRAAHSSSRPLIIHTRQAAKDTLAIMAEEHAEAIGGVMHCFTEDWDIARRALDLNFYISFSGIVTFKNATVIHEVAKKVPADRMLIETDSPYLAPVPFRGKSNHPALVRFVARELAALRQVDYEDLATQTSANFYRCFPLAVE
jgi:TatD DNase family protein